MLPNYCACPIPGREINSQAWNREVQKTNLHAPFTFCPRHPRQVERNSMMPWVPSYCLAICLPPCQPRCQVAAWWCTCSNCLPATCSGEGNCPAAHSLGRRAIGGGCQAHWPNSGTVIQACLACPIVPATQEQLQTFAMMVLFIPSGWWVGWAFPCLGWWAGGWWDRVGVPVPYVPLPHASLQFPDLGGYDLMTLSGGDATLSCPYPPLQEPCHHALPTQVCAFCCHLQVFIVLYYPQTLHMPS